MTNRNRQPLRTRAKVTRQASRGSQPPEKLADVLRQVNRRRKRSTSRSGSLDLLERRLFLIDLIPADHPDYPKARRGEIYTAIVEVWERNLRQIAQHRRGSFESLYYIGDDGEIHFDRDPLVAGLNACNSKHDIRHLRVCAVESCNKLFWAQKLKREWLNDPNAPVGCSSKHQNILRNRRLRRRQKQTPKLNPEEVEGVRRLLASSYGRHEWPTGFTPTKENIERLARLEEKSVTKCKAILKALGYLEIEAG